MRVQTFLCLCIYYGFARYLPLSHSKLGRYTGGGKIRQMLCKHIFQYMGKNVNIEKGAYFGKGSEIEIGDNSGIGVNCHIHPNTKIGKNVMMGPNLYMLDSTHRFDRTDIPMISQGVKSISERCQVVIGDDVWIGRDVMIIGSRRISEGSILGARTLLTKNFPAYSIVGGNPSKLLRRRKEVSE